MSIKVKFILAFSIVILFSTLPLSLFILDNQEKSTIKEIIHHEKTTARILAQSTLNIIMMNGGDIETSSVDAKEMISILQSRTSEALVYADAILLSSKKDLNGRVLASIYKSEYEKRMFNPDDKLTHQEVKRLIESHANYNDIIMPAPDETFYEFAALGTIPGKAPFCIGRIIISKDQALANIKKIKYFVLLVTVLAIIIVGFIGYFFSRYLSRPVEQLIEGVRHIENGKYDYKVSVSSKDEIGLLAETFNEMSLIIKNKIYELEDKNVELSNMNKLKDEFLANTSHELRTPIQGIIGIADTLIDGVAGSMSIEAQKNLVMIVESGNRLARLVDDILDYSKLRHKNINLKLTRIDLNSLTDVVFSILKPLAMRKVLFLKNRISEGAEVVYGDENRVQQVLFNLVGNAIKFTEKGKVEVYTELNPDNDREILICVSDSGIGIAQDNINSIFSSFEQVDGSTSRKYGGTGLGLSISKDIVELHGGKIWVESEIDKGTSFYFTLPVGEGDLIQSFADIDEMPESINNGSEIIAAEGEVASVESKIYDVKNNSARILIVDDEEVNLKVLTNYLGLAGYSVNAVSSGVKAMDLISENGIPDIILLDIMMPVMSGYEVCRKLRHDYPQYELPIVMLTAKNQPQDIVAGFESGANDYISKPFDKNELFSRVKNLIELKNAIRNYNELSLIKEELSIARKIQQAIIPLRIPEVPGVKIAAKYEPMSAVGGDFYDFHFINKNLIGVFIADVTGHGVPAAIIGAMLKAAFSLSFSEALNPASVLKTINSVLYNHISGRFVTANYTLIDLEKGKLISSSAAHWPTFLLRENNNEISEIFSKGPIMGFLPDSSYKCIEKEIEPGDRIVFFTDGIIEQRNSKGEMYSEERFKKFIVSNRDSNPEMFHERLFHSLHEWSGEFEKYSFEDDITNLVVDIV